MFFLLIANYLLQPLKGSFFQLSSPFFFFLLETVRSFFLLSLGFGFVCKVSLPAETWIPGRCSTINWTWVNKFNFFIPLGCGLEVLELKLLFCDLRGCSVWVIKLGSSCFNSGWEVWSLGSSFSLSGLFCFFKEGEGILVPCVCCFSFQVRSLHMMGKEEYIFSLLGSDFRLL